MKKYWKLTNLSIMNALQDRGRVFVWNLYDLVPTLISLGLWIGIYNYSGYLSSGWTISRLVTYFLLFNLLNLFVSINIENDIYRDHIKNGDLANFLVQPLNYFPYLFCLEYGWKIARLFIAIPIAVLIFYLFKDYLQIPVLSRDIVSPLLFILISLPMLFYWKLIIGFFSFWTIENWGLMNFLWMVQALFSGSLFPINFMEEHLANISQFLPFQYLYYVPIDTLMNPSDIYHNLGKIAIALFWLFLLKFIANRMYQKGITRFTDTMQ